MTNITRGSEEVFVPKDTEEKYLHQNKIERRILQNGAQIIGISKSVEDLARAEVHFTFPSGSYNDPRGKEGIHHLFEHLIMNTIGNIEEAENIERNATTSPDEIDVFLKGTANPLVKNFGLWPLLNSISNTLKYPFTEMENLAKEIEYESQVVIGEKLHSEDHSFFLDRAIKEIIYAPGNPILTNGLGTAQSLKKISTSDVLSLAKKVFIPHELKVSFLTEGDKKLSKVFADEIEKNISDFPHKEKKSSRVDKKLFCKLNESFKQGNEYHTTVKNNGRVRIFLPWILPIEEYTVSSVALNRLLNLISHNLFLYTRKEGLSYATLADRYYFEDFTMVYIQIDIQSSNDQTINFGTQIYPELRKYVFEKINDEELEKVNKREQLIQKAVPMSAEDRLSILLDGINNHNRLVDADKMKELYSKVKISHLEQWRNLFLSVNPAFIVVGDI